MTLLHRGDLRGAACVDLLHVVLQNSSIRESINQHNDMGHWNSMRLPRLDGVSIAPRKIRKEILRAFPLLSP